MEIVEKAFDQQIEADGYLDCGFAMGRIVGRKFFLEQVEKELNEKLNEK